MRRKRFLNDTCSCSEDVHTPRFTTYSAEPGCIPPTTCCPAKLRAAISHFDDRGLASKSNCLSLKSMLRAC